MPPQTAIGTVQSMWMMRKDGQRTSNSPGGMARVSTSRLAVGRGVRWYVHQWAMAK